MGACGGLWRLFLVLLTRLGVAITMVLSKVDFDNFCIVPETRIVRFDQIGVRLSQIVFCGVRLGLLRGLSEGGDGGLWLF